MSSNHLNGINENIIHIPYDFDIDFNKGLAEYFWEALNKNKNKIAQIDSTTGKEQTYSEFLDRSIRLTQALQKKGITSEDVVAFCCNNNMEYAVTFVAVNFLGARINPVDMSASKGEIIHCLNLSKPKIIFCDNEIEDVMDAAKYDIVVYNGSKKYISFEEFLAKYKSNEEFKINTSRTGKDTACISYTSGTSGVSKAAELTHFGLYYGGFVGYRFAYGMKKLMIFTSPHWISNLTCMLIALLNGLTRVIYKSFAKETMCKIIQDYKVNVILLPQSSMNELILNPRCCNYDTSELKLIAFGGSNIGINQILQLSKLFPTTPTVNGYGMTEIASLGFIPTKKEYEVSKKETVRITVGKPNPGFYYKIVDQNTGKYLGPNEQGELRIKYEGVTNGYLNNPEATKEAFDEDGYFKTGDLVYYDKDNFFYIVDRIKEIFKYKGYHISPLIIENEFLSHPAVNEVAVIGIPNDEFGELPMGIVLLKDNVKIKEKELEKYVNDRLPDRFHIRAGIKLMSSIPKTTTGKLRRNHLRDLILKGEI